MYSCAALLLRFVTSFGTVDDNDVDVYFTLLLRPLLFHIINSRILSFAFLPLAKCIDDNNDDDNDDIFGGIGKDVQLQLVIKC